LADENFPAGQGKTYITALADIDRAVELFEIAFRYTGTDNAASCFTWTEIGKVDQHEILVRVHDETIPATGGVRSEIGFSHYVFAIASNDLTVSIVDGEAIDSWRRRPNSGDE